MKLLVFPNQLFLDHPGLELGPSEVVLLEDSLFFFDPRYPMKFHKQKLWLHRAAMKRYEKWLLGQGFRTRYLDYDDGATSLQRQLNRAFDEPSSTIVQNEKLVVVDPTDFILEKRLRSACHARQVELLVIENPGFINTLSDNREYRRDKSRWFMADFYKWQRRRLDILMNGDDPVGERWSFDAENRKKVPMKLLSSLPTLSPLRRDSIDHEAREYVRRRFPDHPGSLEQLHHPTSHEQAEERLTEFLKTRFRNFGYYEDAIVEGESWLWHSVITPSLNIGLLTPAEVVEAAIDYASKYDVPLNSLEGFIRQIIGWREFMRATYEDLGVSMRTTNHWKHHRKMSACFYDGSTGIGPVDDTISRILGTGYCHHIERLMVLGGFMFLCEIDPDEIYRWFMEMFVDSYDWVMVPNVYAMSQNADGGSITTKPYFSGSAYVRKQSNHAPGPWCDTWDGLYWRWISIHADELAKNPRWSMMCSMARKMDSEKLDTHFAKAEEFLARLE